MKFSGVLAALLVMGSNFIRTDANEDGIPEEEVEGLLVAMAEMSEEDLLQMQQDLREASYLFLKVKEQLGSVA